MRCLVAILLAFLLSALAPPPDAYAAGSAISGLTKDPTPAVDDLLVAVDVSDPSMASSGTNKKVEIKDLERAGVTTYADANYAATIGGVTLTSADLGKKVFVSFSSSVSNVALWLPNVTSGDSAYVIDLAKEGKGGITVYLTDLTESIGNCTSGASIWVPASGTTKVASLQLCVGPTGAYWMPTSTWPLSGTDRWYFSE